MNRHVRLQQVRYAALEKVCCCIRESKINVAAIAFEGNVDVFRH